MRPSKRDTKVNGFSNWVPKGTRKTELRPMPMVGAFAVLVSFGGNEERIITIRRSVADIIRGIGGDLGARTTKLGQSKFGSLGPRRILPDLGPMVSLFPDHL